MVFALKDMFPTKGLGPNKFHALFYQKFYKVVSEDVLRVVLGFLNGDVDIEEINDTF